MDLGLIFEDVDPRSRYPSLLERLGERRLVHHGSSGGVDEVGRLLHRLERLALIRWRVSGRSGVCRVTKSDSLSRVAMSVRDRA